VAHPKPTPGRAFCPKCGQKYAVPEPELRQRPGLRFRATCRSCETPFSVRWEEEQLITEAEAVLPQGEVDERDVLARGARIGKYEIEEILASGGSSAVYRVFDLGANRTVALKVLHRDPGSDYGVRFRREVEVQGNLKHQNVMPIFDQGTVDGKPFYTMELLHKPVTLETVIGLFRSHRLGYNPALRGLNSLEAIVRRIYLPVARAIDFANRNGIVHRDLKPGNVLIDARTLRVFVIDFGICHLYRETGQRLVLRGDAMEEVDDPKRMAMGTVRYMPPEQAQGEVSEQGDVWAIGALTYYLLKGDAPIAPAIDLRRVSLEKRLRNLEKLAITSRASGDEDEARFYEQRMEELRSGAHRTLREVVRDAQEGVYLPVPDDSPAPLAAIVRRAMQPDPTKRYATVAALSDDMERWINGKSVRAYIDGLDAASSTLYRSQLMLRRNRTAVIAAAIVLVLALAFAALRIVQASSAAEQRQDALLIQARSTEDPEAQEQILTELLSMRPAHEEARKLLALAQTYGPVKRRLDRAREVRDKVSQLRQAGETEAADQLAADTAAVLESSVIPDLKSLPEGYVGRGELKEANDLVNHFRGLRIVSVAGIAGGIRIELVKTRSRRSKSLQWDQAESWDTTPLLVPDHLLEPGSYVLVLARAARQERICIPFRFTHLMRGRIDIICPMDPADVPDGMIYVGGAERVQFGDLLFSEKIETVQVDPFLLDEREVTNAEYARYLATLDPATRSRAVPRRLLPGPGERTTPTWVSEVNGTWAYPQGAADQPVVGVSLSDARAYAAWAGKRLPTAREWEWAARGVDGREFPFGDKLDPDACNAFTGELTDVGQYPRDRSPFGALDMAGNVAEWVEGGSLDQGLIKGGSFDLPRYRAIIASFGQRHSGRPYQDVGFRCAKDVSTGGDGGG
jgi:serine/threonine protein kinase